MPLLTFFVRSFLVLVVVILCTTLVISQNNWEITYAVRAELGISNKSRNFFSLSLAGGIKRELATGTGDFENLGRHFFIAYQPAINIYSNGLGDNILDDLRRVEIDFVNSVFIGGGVPWYEIQNNSIKIKPFTSLTASSVYDDFLSSITIGTNIIMNSHNRNQLVGFLNLNVGRLIGVTYYNDGPPFGGIGLGDRYDRWWTGGGSIEIFFTQGTDPNPTFWENLRLGYYFDRFTGDVQDAYNLSGILGFKYVPARDIYENYYNQARGKFSVKAMDFNFEISYQFLGYLESDIQDLIHSIFDYPFHFTYARKYSMFGLQGTYLKQMQ